MLDKILVPKLIIPILLFYCQLPLGFSDDLMPIQMEVSGLTQADVPIFFRNSIILTYQTDKPIRYIGARFEHEKYNKLHIYAENANGVYYLVIPIPENTGEIKYRIVVDGLWMRDPFNPYFEKDYLLEIEYSVIKNIPLVEREIQNPHYLDNNYILFSLKEKSGADIRIVGDFNNWDPFMHRLIEDSQNPGYYSIKIYVSPGLHYYYFIINGTEITDPYNNNYTFTQNGKGLSFFKVE